MSEKSKGNKRKMDPGIVTDLDSQLTYDRYLRLDQLLDAQKPLSDHHDEMMFIVQHQVAELWFKLMLHELDAVMACMRREALAASIKILGRVIQVQAQLSAEWSVLATLAPSEYEAFRNALGTASGIQSPQYRLLEFTLGNKDREVLPVFRHHLAYYRRLKRALESPSIYDEFLRYLYRAGHRVPVERVERDWSEPYEHHPGVVEVLKVIYQHPEEHWVVYEVCEKLVDIEINFQSWRFRHMKTVERVIGHKRGTGGSSGVAFLREALDITFFPELTEVRTSIGGV